MIEPTTGGEHDREKAGDASDADGKVVLGNLNERHHECEAQDGEEDRTDAPALLLQLRPEGLIERLAHAASMQRGPHPTRRAEILRLI